MEQDTLQWGKRGGNATVNGGTISGQEEMIRVNEEMREQRAINEFRNVLPEYMSNEITQRKGYRNAGNIAIVNK